MPLLDRVRRFICEHDLARPDSRVLVAVSGGPDSVALAHLLHELADAGDLHVAGVAHFNHQLRADAPADERFVAALAAEFGWPFVADREDVAALARRERRSIEAAGRAARYAFFERAVAATGADRIALGHTRDDQAETVLLRLLRGAGPRGLSAMHPRNGFVVRPLLDCRRAELVEYLDARGAAHLVDSTNEDVSIPRNRVRAELLPLLEARFNPQVVDALADQADLARGTWRWMEAAAVEAYACICHPGEGRVWRLDAARLCTTPAALARLVVWRAMREAGGGRHVGLDHVRAALRLLDGPASAALDAPGQRVERAGGWIVLTRRAEGRSGRSGPPPVNLFRYSLSIPGEVRLAEAACVLSAAPLERATPAELAAARAAGPVAIVRSDVCPGPLTVRNRRPGDRFRPIGLGGRKKLQDFFVDRKVARWRRDLVPLVVDGRDRIVWVAGYGIDAEFRVTEPTQAVLLLRLRQA